MIKTTIICFILSFTANASGYHHHHKGEKGDRGEQGVAGIDGKDGVNGLNAANTTKGVASAIAASQLNFDWSTDALQGSAGIGVYNSTAISFGMAKRVGKTIISGSANIEDGKISGGAGVSWRF
jgi:hypothetical protein